PPAATRARGGGAGRPVPAGRLDDEVGAVAARERTNGVGELPGARVDDRVRAEPPGRLEPLRTNVRRDQRCRAARLRGGGREGTDPADADDEDRLPRLDPPPPQGVQGDGEWLRHRRSVVGARVGNADAHAGRGERVLGEATVGLEAERVVAPAEVRAPRAAGGALAAPHAGAGNDARPEREAVGTLASRRDDAGELVSEDDARVRRDQVRAARPFGRVGAADRGARHPQEHLAAPRWSRLGHLLDPDVARAVVDRCLHRALRSVCVHHSAQGGLPVAEQPHSVCLTFDFDGMSIWIGSFKSNNPSMISRGEFGGTVGLDRVLRLLAKHDARGTFFVPGHTAWAWPDLVKKIADAGHEIGHHGWVHENPATLELEAEREVMERGFEALDHAIGVRPQGYRSAAWDFSPNTIDLLLEYNLLYSSSCMASDFTPRS